MSFEFRSKRRNGGCCAYNIWQWVPYPWSSNRERALTSRCSGSWNEKSRSLGWSGWWIMCLRYKILMQIRGLAIHDGLESEKRNFILKEADIQLPLKRSSRFQRLFPNPSWLVWGRASRHQKLAPTFPGIDSCLMVTKRDFSKWKRHYD